MPADITTTLGSAETFETIVAGTPRPEVVWLRDGKELKKSKRTLFEEEPNPEGGFKYRVSFADIVLKDFGTVSVSYYYHYVLYTAKTVNVKETLFYLTRKYPLRGFCLAPP